MLTKAHNMFTTLFASLATFRFRLYCSNKVPLVVERNNGGVLNVVCKGLPSRRIEIDLANSINVTPKLNQGSNMNLALSRSLVFLSLVVALQSWNPCNGIALTLESASMSTLSSNPWISSSSTMRLLF
jgi:hypothetical protein